MEKRFLINVLEDCQLEFNTLTQDKEWFCTKVVEQIQEALEMLQERPDNAIT